MRTTLTLPTSCALSGCQSAAAPYRRRARKELAADEAFSRHFAGMEGGSAGRPSDPDIVAVAARNLGERVTSVRTRGYPAVVAPSMDDYAQLERVAAEVFGERVPIQVRRCTQLASTSLERPVLDLQLEGVPLDWAGMFLPSVDSRVPDRDLGAGRVPQPRGAVCPCGAP